MQCCYYGIFSLGSGSRNTGLQRHTVSRLGNYNIV
uniref:Uncharacterized protein n=1 Tax=Anguilla anguilla TaxID=7936 RepID=A0A0E9XH10_ANGAN